jgi:NAD(P)-dependent dehydrogenase (short-subunit alcohol dehydrogenase family)
MFASTRTCSDAGPGADAVIGGRRHHWIGQASDVAAAAVFYASDEAAFITGTTLLVDGGMTAGYLQREHGPEADI